MAAHRVQYPAPDELHAELRYEDGSLYWRNAKGKRKMNAPVGTVVEDKRRHIVFSKCKHEAERAYLAFLNANGLEFFPQDAPPPPRS